MFLTPLSSLEDEREGWKFQSLGLSGSQSLSRNPLESPHWNKRCSLCSYHLEIYKGFRRSVSGRGTKTGIRTRDTPSILITYEIPRLLGILCQESVAGTNMYIFYDTVEIQMLVEVGEIKCSNYDRGISVYLWSDIRPTSQQTQRFTRLGRA